MAKANWLKVAPSQGSGNATVNVSSTSEHTGRNARTTTLTWKAANVANITRTVSQAGKPEYVDIADAASADKLGKIVTISGVSNSAKLTFSFGTGDLLDITLPNTYTANSVATNNGAAISGDPGATAEYNFSISITVPANNDMAIIYPWDYYLNKVLTEGMMVTYEDKPWRVRQTHTPLEIYPPSLATASLYEAIDKEHSGDVNDPIPYTPPMEVFIDKCYMENGIVYRCIRDSGIALTHSLDSLVGLYVEKL